MPRKDKVFVVIKSDGSVRAARNPRLGGDEVAIRLDITFPDGWGRVTQVFDVQMPSPPVAAYPEGGTDG